MTHTVNLMLIGAIALASLSIALFFLRFWKTSGDRFFLFFAASFMLEGCSRIAQGLFSGLDENGAAYYLIRFASYCLIIVAIVDKNCARNGDK